MSSLGDCYEVHGRFMLDNFRDADEYILVHAEVMGQGQLAGVPYGHCFLIHKQPTQCMIYLMAEI